MMRSSLRFRLTVWYSLALAAGLALFACAIWFSMRHGMMTEIDRTLEARAVGIGRFLDQEMLVEKTTQLGEELNEFAGGLPAGAAVSVRDARGKLLLETRPGFPFSSIPAVEAAWSGHRYRLLTVRHEQGSSWLRIDMAEPLDGLESVLAELRWLLILCIPPVIAAAVAGGNWLSGRALKPVDEITRAARSVGIGNLSERLTVPRTGDELERLAETWNGMLARIETAVKRLSRFTADASHELRTPLAIIRTTAEIAGRRDRTPEEYQDALGQIVAESQRMTQLVEDLLFLARCDADSAEMPMEPLEIRPVVEDACRQARAMADTRGIAVEMDLGESAGAGIVGNCAAIRQLLLVLLDNAVKYSPAGATVRVTAADGKVEISDSGPGIPESDMPHIFERFYRARQRGAEGVPGYGLGLSLADAIAKRHGAKIEVARGEAAGTTFRLLFANCNS